MSPTSSARLSIVIIVKNDAQALAETLESVRGIADEMIVVDTGSTDNTSDVAVRAGAQLVECRWQDSFSDARNFAQQFVMGNWILWLDAGETILSEEASQLRQFLDTEAKPSSAYAMVVQVPGRGTTVAQEQISRVRIIPNLTGLQFEGAVRESLTASLIGANIQIEGLPFRVRRGMREHDAAIKIGRARRNVQLADMQIARQGPSASMLNCLGEAFQTLGENVRATQQFRSALECSQSASPDMLEAYYGLLTTLDGDVNNRETQLSICLKALEVFPIDAQLLCALGNYLHNTNRLELATRSFEAAFRFGQVHPEVWHLSEIREIAAGCWAMTLLLQNQDASAQQALESALAEFPESSRLRRQLMELHIKHGRRQEALAQFDLLPRKMPQRELLKSVVRGASLAGAGNWISARAYLQTAYNGGCRDPLCLKWLSLALTASGDKPQALAIAREWEQLDPQNMEVRQYLTALSSKGTLSSGEATDRSIRIDSASSESPSPNVSASIHTANSILSDNMA